MNMADKGLAAVDRLATPQEKQLILWLIEHGDAEVSHLRTQVDDLHVISKCICGCPTIYFGSNGEPISRKGEILIADFLAKVNGEDVGVMLFHVEGQLSSLEVYSQAGSAEPFGLPEIASIYPYGELNTK